jgi:MFS family permease
MKSPLEGNREMPGETDPATHVGTPRGFAVGPTRPRRPMGAQAEVPAAVWRLAAVVTFGATMAGLDTSVANVGLNTIRRNLGASLGSAQWITSGHLLALAGALPACGWLSRRIGAGRLWLGALAGFTLASGLCAIAPNLEALIAFRVLQGIAGALLIAQLSWRWLFLINLPIGVLGLTLGWPTVPGGDRDRSARIDLPGLLLVGAGLPLLVYAITQAAQLRTLLGATVLLPLLAGIGALTAFTQRSLRHASPPLDLRLVSNRVYAAASVEVLFGGAALFGGLIVMPLYFQLQREAGIVDTGLLLVAFSVGAATTFPIAGWLTDKYGGGMVASIGLLVTVASTVPFALLAADAGLAGVETLQVVRGIGLALAGQPVLSAAFATVQRHQLPDATSQINIISRVGGALGSALFVVILTQGLSPGGRGAATADAFHATFWWLTVAALAALVAAMWLVVEQRRAGTARPGTEMKEKQT